MQAPTSSSLFENTFHGIRSDVERFKLEARAVYLTSSFQTQSVPLLHMVSQLAKDAVQVVVIDTGFLFPETYLFAHALTEQLGIHLLKVRSERTFAEQMTQHGNFLFASDIDVCCHLNKVEPMRALLNPGDVWISGIRADQSKVRAEKARLETDSAGVLRYHPFLEWTAKDVYRYIQTHNLPRHPLENDGYKSIGCVPCTRKWNALDFEERGGRWEGSAKTECGLHTE
ncbi:MAG: phosphoadenylyl-sulfate reductase [Flavobacteriales bacterium]